MRIWIVLGVVGAMSAPALELGHAQDQTPEGAWCARENIGEGVVAEKCHYASFAECRAGNDGMATTFCTQNPRYVAPSQPAGSASTGPRPATRR
jgi:hypothetical protein